MRMACFLYYMGTIFVKKCFGDDALTGQGVSVVYGSTNNRLRIREKVEWIVCHSDDVSSSETTTCNHQFSEYE